MPEITTVWAVYLDQGSPLDTRGTLVLTDTEVAFSGDDGRRTRIPLTRIRRVKRVLGSPIMIVAHDDERGRHRTAFYFSEPPPLHPPEEVSRMRRKRAKKASVGYLGQQNINRKPVIKRWVEEIEDAIGRLRGSAQAGSS
jgi:hypothetical protein